MGIIRGTSQECVVKAVGGVSPGVQARRAIISSYADNKRRGFFGGTGKAGTKEESSPAAGHCGTLQECVPTVGFELLFRCIVDGTNWQVRSR